MMSPMTDGENVVINQVLQSRFSCNCAALAAQGGGLRWDRGRGCTVNANVQTLPEGSALCSLAEGRPEQIRWRGHAEDKGNAASKKKQSHETEQTNRKKKHVDAEDNKQRNQRIKKLTCISVQLCIATLHTDILSYDSEEGTEWTLAVFLRSQGLSKSLKNVLGYQSASS